MQPIRRLIVWAVDPDADLGPLLGEFAQISPRFEVIDRRRVMIDINGPARYFGGEDAVASRVAELFMVHGLVCGVGVADGYVATCAAALQSAGGAPPMPVVVPKAGSQRYLEPMSVARLVQIADLPAEFADLMGRLGIRTCGDLIRLPPQRLMARFGVVGELAHRLALGHDRYPLVTVTPEVEQRIEVLFDDPVTQVDQVAFATKRLVDPVIDELSRAGCICTRFDVAIETEHGERIDRSWYLDGGFGVAAVVQRIRWQLEAWVDTPGAVTAGVVLVAVTIAETRAGTGEQVGLWGQRSRADDAAARAIDRLGALVGAEAVQMAIWSGGRLVDERYRLVPANSLDEFEMTAPRHLRAWRGAFGGMSPTQVRSEPLSIELIDHRGHPVVVSGRGELSASPATMAIDGRDLRIIDHAGPWLIDQRWWSPLRRRVAQVQVIDELLGAHLLWRRDQRWWLVGCYG